MTADLPSFDVTLDDARISFATIADLIVDEGLRAISASMLRLGLHRGLDREDIKILRPLVAIIVATNLANMSLKDRKNLAALYANSMESR